MAFLIEITGEESVARLTVHSVESSPEVAKACVETALKNNGFLPNLIGVLANAPAALAMYQQAVACMKLKIHVWVFTFGTHV